MGKKLIFAVLISFIYLIHFVAAVPKIVPYVNDFGNVLTQDQISNLNLYLDQVEKNTSYEIAVVTVQDTEGQDRLEYANEIGDQNGVGKKGQDNGIVILYSLKDGGGGANTHFGGYDGKVVTAWGSQYAVVKTNESVINPNCEVSISDAMRVNINLIPIVFGIFIVFTSIWFAYTGFRNSGLA